MAEYQVLVKKRALQKAFLTRCEKFINNLDTQSITYETNIELEMRLSKLSDAFDIFNNIQDEIELSEGEVDYESEQAEREKFESRYYRICSQIKALTRQMSSDAASVRSETSNAPPDSSFQNSTADNGDNSVKNTLSNQTNQILSSVMFPQAQLPLLKLPVFNGEYSRWVEFRDGFEALVHKNPILSDVQKLHHLRSCLGKEALDTIKSIPITASNYQLAFNLLRERYERNRLIVQSHIKAIVYLPRPSKDSARDLRNFFNEASNNLQSLKNLQEPVEFWDTILVTLITEKLDPITRHEWERYSTLHDSNSLKDLFNLISNRCEILEKLECNKESPHPHVQTKFIPDKRLISKNKPHQGSYFIATNANPQRSCFHCKGNHPIYYCSKFLSLSPKQRENQIKRIGICRNCLQSTHKVPECKSSFRCKRCGELHNTLLHTDSQESDSAKQQKTTGSQAQTLANVNAENFSEEFIPEEDGENQILLSTAIIYIKDSEGNAHKCRALLDNGAMSNFITKGLKERLGLKSTPASIAVTGVGQSLLETNSVVDVSLASKHTKYQRQVKCIVIDNITSNIPVVSFPKSSIQIPNSIKLADTEFHLSQPVDLLLGASVFWQILRPTTYRIPNSQVYLQKTDLGWVLGGQLSIKMQRVNKSVNCASVDKKLEQILSRFWEVEEMQPPQKIPDDQCEINFKQNTTRDENGRFVVKIPFKQNYRQLGQTKHKARERFFALEKKLLKNPPLHKEYIKFMDEYIHLGHMIPLEEGGDSEELNYYIPHHPVIRLDSLTTKLRVVFNASLKSDSGLSLNDVQHTGPTIQTELASLLMNFRIHKFVTTADISKMYRMIRLHPEHTKFHRIFWRNSQSQPLKSYELQTVTYGTASASYLAIRCLHQLAEENRHKFPEACEIIKNNFYVDDLLCGANTEEELIRLQNQVTIILKSAGFELRKWLSNKRELCDQFNIDRDLECSVLPFGDQESTKTLGVAWNAFTDCFQYTHTATSTPLITKRKILSELAQIFDPLGLLGPVIITGKILMQNLWQDKVSWDSPLTQDVYQKWQFFREQLKQLNSINVPRHIILQNSHHIELHGFGDASQRAYGAAIYITSKNGEEIASHLLCAKSRVAPLKQQTLPRLELCAAVLVAQLAAKVRKVLKIKFHKLCFWSDSTIVLSWIKSSPLRWKTFVANRVGEIHRLTNQQDWYHVSSADNPADILSRGINSDLSREVLWWQGPKWLKSESFPVQPLTEENRESLIEAKISVHLAMQNPVISNFISKFSNLNKLKRIVAYCFRFCFNCSNRQEKKVGPLQVEEIQAALKGIILADQREHFQKEYNSLQQGRAVSNTSSLLSLNPFLHEDQLMRVGGRIKNSLSEFSKRHPIILHPRSHLTKLIFRDIHNSHFHCGPTHLLSAIREQFWPVNGRSLAKLTVRNCKVCFLAKPKATVYQMGNLPASRVNRSIPFTHVGLDYAGPFQLRDRTTRGAKILKGYVCIFICLSTKAMHLEVVSDLTTDCFISCLKRFISRRGKPTHIYSDNSKTFVGANFQLKKIYNLIKTNAEIICNFLSKDSIQWHFIPARAPNFGGLWEAGVKRIKHHLKRVLGTANLTFEQFYTVLCQIECILNSRPLCPISSNPDDLEPLTPGHFLIHKTPMSIPEGGSFQQVPTNRLRQYQRLQQIHQHFWTRWHREYLSELQQRSKWKTNTNQDHIKEGTLVILKEDNTPSMAWPLARIVALHPGDDGIIRVVTVKSNGKLYKRPLSKICILPNEL